MRGAKDFWYNGTAEIEDSWRGAKHLIVAGTVGGDGWGGPIIPVAEGRRGSNLAPQYLAGGN